MLGAAPVLIACLSVLRAAVHHAALPGHGVRQGVRERATGQPPRPKHAPFRPPPKFATT